MFVYNDSCSCSLRDGNRDGVRSLNSDSARDLPGQLGGHVTELYAQCDLSHRDGAHYGQQ
jgi:hypothetical protein